MDREYTLIRDSEGLRQRPKIILPGVGHFGQMMRALDELRRARDAARSIASGRSVPGNLPRACRRCSKRAKKPRKCGASGIFPGAVRRFAPGARVPHMGWNELERAARSRLAQRRSGASPTCTSRTATMCPIVPQAAAICTYEVPYTAVIEAGNVHGVQFHPEKSGAVGLGIVRNFLRMLAKRIIPCLDVTGGRVVKGVNFVNLRDAGDPVELAERYNREAPTN